MRITTTIVIFFILFNAFAAAITASGMNEKWDTQPSAGDTEQLTTAKQSADSISASGGGLSTLFGLIVSVGSTIGTIFSAALPGVSLLNDAGVPLWILGFITSPLAIISGIELADFFRGIG
jgi:hypothetical protein